MFWRLGGLVNSLYNRTFYSFALFFLGFLGGENLFLPFLQQCADIIFLGGGYFLVVVFSGLFALGWMFFSALKSFF